MKKILTTFTLIVLAIAIGSISASTLTTNAESLNNVRRKTSIATVSKNVVTNNMIAQLQKKEIKPGSKLISQKTVFIRIDNKYPNGIKKFTPEEYYKQIAEEKLYSPYGWLELELDVYNFQGQYTAYGYYQWKTAPQMLLNDQISITGTDITFGYKGSSLQVFNPVATSLIIYNSQSKEMTESLNGITYQFPLRDNYFMSKINPYGVIIVPINRMTYNQTSANLTLEYVHTQIPQGIAPGFSLFHLIKMKLQQWLEFTPISNIATIRDLKFHVNIETPIQFNKN